MKIMVTTMMRKKEKKIKEVKCSKINVQNKIKQRERERE